ncbi:VOC family protein [Kineosporia sp. J2-2]|uniref:VOC family protein n=1 Tax=Kineosporia corallincola TaxID=2835133 RepID=A0ABS5TF19_9ACTN|nr:VOC family protein [Kineosporia corallincola]MBT0769677.1 VOC family protein [Kineosporia corallincola]
MDRPSLTLTGIVLDTDDVEMLSEFYRRLLGWELDQDELPDWRKLRAPGGAGLSFQLDERYRPPVWPAGDDQTPMQLHLDILVTEMAPAVAWAQECGAALADFQPQDDVRVLLDPSGHPFCLYLPET